MFLDLFFKKPESEISLLFHIGSRSVSGSIVRLSKKDKPKIFYSARVPIPFQKNLNPERLLPLTLQALEKVCLIVQREGLTHLTFTEFKSKKIKEVLFVFSAPWYVSETKLVTIKKDKPFKVTRELLESVLKDEKIAFEKSTLPNAEDPEEKIVPLEKKIIQIKLNGYETSRPYGKEASEVEVALFLSLIPSDVFMKVKNMVGKFFHYSSYESASFSLLSYSVARDIFSDINAFMVMNISGEMTDISLVKNGVLLQSYSFPLGRNFLVRSLCEAFDASPEVCLSSISLFLEKKTLTDPEAKIKQTLEATRKEWSVCLEDAFTSLSSTLYLPQTIYVLTEKDLSSFFIETMTSTELGKYTGEGDPFKVVVIDENIMGNYSSWADKTSIDSAVSMESIFFNKIFQLREQNNLLYS